MKMLPKRSPSEAGGHVLRGAGVGPGMEGAADRLLPWERTLAWGLGTSR